MLEFLDHFQSVLDLRVHKESIEIFTVLKVYALFLFLDFLIWERSRYCIGSFLSGLHPQNSFPGRKYAGKGSFSFYLLGYNK